MSEGIRRFRHINRFEDDTDYLEYRPIIDRVVIVNKSGEIAAVSWTLEDTERNVREGYWRELSPEEMSQ